MRRKQGVLLPIEVSILSTAVALALVGQPEFHGYAVARELRDRDEARRLTAHGTLYRALERLETGGMLESRAEEPEVAAAEQRPRRRLYHITAVGRQALAEATSRATAQMPGGLRSRQVDQ